MSDYIEREDAYNRLTKYYHHTRDIQHESLRIALNGIPSADVAPVVRCKDCDYWNELDKGIGVCKRLVEAMWVDYTDFCSFAENKDDITYGERKDDE